MEGNQPPANVTLCEDAVRLKVECLYNKECKGANSLFFLLEL